MNTKATVLDGKANAKSRHRLSPYGMCLLAYLLVGALDCCFASEKEEAIVADMIKSGVLPNADRPTLYSDGVDAQLFSLIPYMPLLDTKVCNPSTLRPLPNTEHYAIRHPDEKYAFLHESAIIRYKGTLFAAWYNCPVNELKGHTPIQGRRSTDGGRTWTADEVLVDDPEGRLLACPPVYGIDSRGLYLLCNMETAPDCSHTLDVYRYDEATAKFTFVSSSPTAFKLNTNAYEMDNGKLLLPGRVAPAIDGFPNIPAALISDNGFMEGPWRLVKLQENQFLVPNSYLKSSYVHPEMSNVVIGRKVFSFCRNDQSCVPLVFFSDDFAETWTGAYSCNIPFAASKIYSGTLKDGRNYVIGNIYSRTRSNLAIFFSEPGTMRFTRGGTLRNGTHMMGGRSYCAWHYPVAYESDGKLYVIYTMNLSDTTKRGAGLSVITL